MAPADRRAFILENTRALTPPLVPELRLQLADEAVPIWRKTEEELGELGLPPPFWAFAWAGGQALARFVLDRLGVVDPLPPPAVEPDHYVRRRSVGPAPRR